MIRVPGRLPLSDNAAVSLSGLRKVFGTGDQAVTAVDGVDLEVRDGEFFSMLGPSGSGKTTVLRIIAGFELPTSGTVLLGGMDVSRRAPFERDVNTVFQDYALFPHMTSRTTSGTGCGCARSARPSGGAGWRRRWRPYGSRATARGAPRSSPAASGSGSPWPGRWSTGPGCCCSTSRSARSTSSCARRCRSSSRRIQRDAGITFIFVTHDQEEALTMCDRVAVFNAGRIEQVGAPAEVYEAPATAFVAGFVGTSNLLSPAAAQALSGGEGLFSIRPEKLRIAGRTSAGDGELSARRRRAPRSSTSAPRPGSSSTSTLGGRLVALPAEPQQQLAPT